MVTSIQVRPEETIPYIWLAYMVQLFVMKHKMMTGVFYMKGFKKLKLTKWMNSPTYTEEQANFQSPFAILLEWVQNLLSHKNSPPSYRLLILPLEIKIQKDWIRPWRFICSISSLVILTRRQTRERLCWAKDLPLSTVRRISLSNKVITLIQNALNDFPGNTSPWVGATAAFSPQYPFNSGVSSNF